MRWRGLVLVLAGCVIVAGLVYYVCWPDHEPKYQGRLLTEWIEIYAGTHPTAGLNAIAEENISWVGMVPESEEALRQFGTNALPFLLKWIRNENREPGELQTLIYKLPPRILYNPIGLALLRDRAEERADPAMRAFEYLGPKAAPAIPRLVALACGLRAPATAERAIRALAWIGKDGLAALYDTATNERQVNREHLVGRIEFVLSDDSGALAPMYSRLVTDQDTNIAIQAARDLRRSSAARAVVLPAMTNVLHSPCPELREIAVDSIGDFAEQSRDLAPLLIQMVNDQDFRVRWTVTNSLRRMGLQVPRR